MSNIHIVKKGVTKLDVDAVVNAANSQLMEGGGVCGAIFAEAGSKELTEACKKIGHCSTGSAVITPGFNLKAKYIIHAVGPVWNGGNSDEPKQLYGCYKKALLLAKEHGCKSIGFPLISAGIFGYPKDKAWRKAIQACHDFIADNSDYEIDIYFAVLDETTLKQGIEVMTGLEYVSKSKEEHDSAESIEKAKKHFREYVNVFRLIDSEEELKKWCKDCAYSIEHDHHGLARTMYRFMDETISGDFLVYNYEQVLNDANLDFTDKDKEPNAELINKLNDIQLLAFITWHFRMEHNCNGSMISYSIAEGHLLKLIEAFIK